MRKSLILVAMSALLSWGGVAAAHHSFAVFFDTNKIVKVTGKVTEFQFKNPHGVILLDAVDKQGKVESWRVETNAPSLMSRRGWTRQSLRPGEIVTIEGWGARAGNNYMRIRSATRADGTPIGNPSRSVSEQQ